MSNLKIFSENIKINSKRVIVRLDLNVPISKSSIEDSTRIEIIEPFIKKLIEKKAKIILISHLGRPKGKVVKELSLNPIFDYLQKSLNTKVYFYKDNTISKRINLRLLKTKNLAFQVSFRLKIKLQNLVTMLL